MTRAEAELLVDLERATSGAASSPEWADLFANGVANALMFPRGAPVVPDAAEATRCEGWLESRRGIAALLVGIGRAVVGGDAAFGDTARLVDRSAAIAKTRPQPKMLVLPRHCAARRWMPRKRTGW